MVIKLYYCMHVSKFLMQKVIEFIFHIYATNTCSLHFRIQVSYGFIMLIFTWLNRNSKHKNPNWLVTRGESPQEIARNQLRK